MHRPTACDAHLSAVRTVRRGSWRLTAASADARGVPARHRRMLAAHGGLPAHRRWRRCDRSINASSPPASYRASHTCSVWREMPHDAATSVIVRPSAMTADTALYRCSATLISLMEERQGSTGTGVNPQPEPRQPSTEHPTSSISRNNTTPVCAWADSNCRHPL